MRSKILVLLILLITIFFSEALNAQQEDIFSFSVLNKEVTNPSFSGIDESLNVYVLSRLAFQGIENAPQNYYVGASMPMEELQGAVGIKANIDNIGFETRFAAYLDYAFKLELNDETNQTLRFGLSLGAIQQQINTGGLKFRETTDSFTSSNTAKLDFNSAFGIVYTYKLIQVGATALNLTEPELNLNSTGVGGLSYKYKRFYSVQSSIRKGVTKDIVVVPNLFMYSDLSTFSLYFSTLLEFYDKFYAGLGYKHESLGLMLGMTVEFGVDFFVSYDAHINQVGRKANSFEGGLKYLLDFSGDKNRKIRVNRFL